MSSAAFRLELLDELVSTANLVGETPGIGRVIGAASDGRPIRQLRVRRFPYAIVYVELASHVRVIAVAHGKRFPEYWKHRVR